MSKSDDEEKKMPEWSIFDRIDELEDLTLKLMDKTEQAEPALKDIVSLLNDAIIMGKAGIIFSFIIASKVAGHEYRKGRDIFIEELKRQGLSKGRLEEVEHNLTELCKLIEERKNK